MNPIERDYERRMEGRLRRSVCFIDIDAPDPPAPDPNIGIAARENAALSKEMAQVAREELQYRRERDARLEPLFTEAMERSLAISEANAERAGEAWERYKEVGIPAADEYLEQARKIGGTEDQTRAAGRAVADVDTQFDIADEVARRDMARAGVTPGEGASVVGKRLALLGRAGARAGAATRARENQHLLGLAAKEGAAKFTAGLPSQGLAADQAALAGSSSFGATAATQANIRNAGVAGAGNLLSGAGSLNASAGNLLLGQHQAQLDAYKTGLEYEAGMWGALGNIAGAGAGVYALGMKKGGMVRRRAPKMLRYAAGGKVAGPGGPTDDAVPAVIDGQEPAALSSGEFVVKADSTAQYGEETMNDVNAGEAEVVPAKVLIEIGRNQVRGLVLAMAKRPAREPVTIENGG